ncbi:hypothetical protein K8374_02735 [Pseudomonas sp. p1(2021b)]|uniref:DUF6515 family protein n=1 Tax=Pseudomonas sp. p1(2021b) TaxID=2874628 RepID=UPI001CC96096|nr:DUF6515 family protein [Pseudomonas sp. p1(2021b)]UBM25940.1 hypothetical protein K8374_02735 [Pseudomonas sp. p1(2021b)]
MTSRIRQLAGIGLLGLGISLGTLAQESGPQDPNGGAMGTSPLNSRDEVRQTQPPRQGYYQDIPRRGGHWDAGGPGQRPGGDWAGRPDGHGDGWGPGPQYRPGHRVDRFADRYWKVPYQGQDYFYSGGYWYRPNGGGYIVVTPPYGVRVGYLPSYAREVWVGDSLFFLVADSYYQYLGGDQGYVVVNPPNVLPPPGPALGTGYDVVAHPLSGQTPAQQDQDRYQCHRWAVQQSGFDPASASAAPPVHVADAYHRALGACLSDRGYSVN